MNRVFVDLDGVVVDFAGYMKKHDISGDVAKKRDNAYLDMLPIEGAIEAVRALIDAGYEVWIATKPPTGVSQAYADKAAWIYKYLPELERRIIITHDKGLLGDGFDYLCDDRPHKANCEEFAGDLLRFENGYGWDDALEVLLNR